MKVAESFDQEEHEVVGVKERGGRWWMRSAPPRLLLKGEGNGRRRKPQLSEVRERKFFVFLRWCITQLLLKGEGNGRGCKPQLSEVREIKFFVFLCWCITQLDNSLKLDFILSWKRLRCNSADTKFSQASGAEYHFKNNNIVPRLEATLHSILCLSSFIGFDEFASTQSRFTLGDLQPS